MKKELRELIAAVEVNLERDDIHSLVKRCGEWGCLDMAMGAARMALLEEESPDETAKRLRQ